MNQTATAALPDPQDAYNNLVEGVHADVFFRKCAAAGHVPESVEEARAMLEVAFRLRDVSRPTKQAAAGGRYQQLLQATGQAPADPAYAIKAAAQVFADDPTVYNSVLSLKAHQADQIRAQLAARQ